MDKREAVRVPVRVPALCRSDGIVIDGFVEDLSRTGAFLRSSKLMATGSPAEVCLQLPGEPVLQLNAEVVRVEHNSQRAGMGRRFVPEGQEGRPLANFIMRQHSPLR